MGTSFNLLPVDTSDAGVITHSIDIPSMQNGPLSRTKFPTYSTMSSAAQEAVTQWYVDGLAEALEDARDGLFSKACQQTNYGVDNGQLLPVGFCGCEIIERDLSHDATDHQQLPAQETTIKENTTSGKQGQSAVPEFLNVDGWLGLSGKPRMERRRVLMGWTVYSV